MGQTLTHGVYLPAEGERNCYGGLASNWNILDGAVGTIAEHTTALAGKAPAVHTHTKSDVTDLLNSNFIPSANNSYDLGSSSYQWNNVYSKNYFYNGTAWGLDKENVWTANNTFSNSIVYFKLGSSGSYNDIRWKDNNDSHYATLRSKVNELTLGLQYSSASAWYSGASVNINNQGSVQIKAYDGTEPWTVNFTPVGVYPTSNNALELGTSTNKWKSLNGTNPGALSFPDTATTDASGNIIPPSGESSINLSGSANTFTPSKNGWLTLAINCASGNCIIVRQNISNRDTLNYMQGYVPGQTNIYLTLPVLAGVTYYIFLYATSFVMARFALCQGNV